MNPVNLFSGRLVGKSNRPQEKPSPRPSPFSVPFGQLTFDAEGGEAPGLYFSRAIHWPGGASGVTIGRGYDMGQRTRLQVTRELSCAGVSEPEALILSNAAGMRGRTAERFVQQRRGDSPILTPIQQQRLFEIVTTFETVSDIKRILSKPDLIRLYGAVNWESLPREIQEVLFDLRYRGDYTPTVRARIQPMLSSSNRAGVAEVLLDTDFWRAQNVPEDRIFRRQEYARERLFACVERACA